MTMNNEPFPKAGDILNYIFLFGHEAETRDEGIKVRPCVVVEVIPEQKRVRVAPLTAKGERYPDAPPLPEDVARKANLVHPTAVVVSETNIFTWLGYDLRPLHRTNSIYVGRLTPKFTHKGMDLVRNAKSIDRD